MSGPVSAEEPKGWVRIATALLGAPIVLGGAYLGGIWFCGLILLIGLISMLEVGSLFQSAETKPFVPLAVLLGVLVVGRTWIPGWDLVATAVALASLAAIPFLAGRSVPNRMAATFFIVVYPVWLLSFLIDVRNGTGIDRPDEVMMRITILVVLLVWASDTCSYYAGKAVGSRPFFPSVSPKKTWEGFLGGLVGTALVGLLAKILGLVESAWPEVAALVVLCGLGAPIGDLIESKMKRSFAVKDSGTLLPGHGGMLDRFDGMIMCAPLVWLYLVFG